MSWCRLESGYLRHPKTLRLCALLRDDDADRFLPRLWAWAAGNCPTGSLPEHRARMEFESAVLWQGERGQFFGAIVKVGLVSLTQGVATIRNWQAYNGHHLRESERLRRRKVSNFETARVEARVSSDAVRTDGRTDVRTNGTASTLRVERHKAAKKAPVVELVKPPAAHTALVEAFGAVYLEHVGQTYRHHKVDFIQAAELARQGVTPSEATKVAQRAFRPGISPWLQARDFKQFATRYANIAAARSETSTHNVATADELAASESKYGQGEL